MSWGSAKLGEIAPSKPLKNPEIHDESNVWLLNLDMVESQTGQVINKYKADISEAGSSSTNWFGTSHVLYSKLRPYLNKVVLPDEQGLATAELVPMLPDSKWLDRSYLVYYLRSKKFVDWVSAQVVSTKIPRVSMKVFWEHDIPIPFPDDSDKSLKEQKRIAAILDKADAIRRKRQQAIELADQFLHSVFLDMFGDPVTNPKRWKVKAMDKIVHIQGGYAFNSTDFVSEGTPVIKVGNVNKLGFTVKDVAFVLPDNTEKLKQYELYPGDLLMSLTGIVGKDDYGNIIEVTDDYDKYYFNQRVAKITFDQNIMSKNYLKYYFSQAKVKGEITKNNRGVRQANISNLDIYSLSVPVPRSDLLQCFDEVVSKLTLIKENTATAVPLAKMSFNSLSQRAFAGEL